MRREEVFMEILGGLDEKYVALAMPRSCGHDAAGDSCDVTAVRTVNSGSGISRSEVRRYMIVRALGMAAAAVLITGAAVLLIMNWDKIAVKDKDKTKENPAVTVASEITTPEHSDTAPTDTEKTDPPETTPDPIEYTYPRENVFLYKDMLYEIDASAAFDYVIKTDNGYASIFRNEYPEYDETGFVDPVSECLKDVYRVGELKYVEGMPHSEMETNFAKNAELYSFSFGNKAQPAESTDKYIVAEVSQEEYETIRKYFSDQLSVPDEELKDLRGVYYVLAQTTIMPPNYYNYFSPERAADAAGAAFKAEGMDRYFRTGNNYMSFPLPIFSALNDGDGNERTQTGEVIFYLGNGGDVFAAIIDGKVDESWELSAVNDAFANGENVMLVSDTHGNTAMLTESGEKFIISGDALPENAEYSEDTDFPIHRWSPMRPLYPDYELTQADLDEIYEKTNSVWGEPFGRSLGYPVSVDLTRERERGWWYVPVFEGDTIVGTVTATYADDGWLCSTYSENAEQLNELYESGEPFNLVLFGSAQYICTKNKKSTPLTYSVYDKPRSVYLYDETKAAPLRKWKEDGENTSDLIPEALNVIAQASETYNRFFGYVRDLEKEELTQEQIAALGLSDQRMYFKVNDERYDTWDKITSEWRKCFSDSAIEHFQDSDEFAAVHYFELGGEVYAVYADAGHIGPDIMELTGITSQEDDRFTIELACCMFDETDPTVKRHYADISPTFVKSGDGWVMDRPGDWENERSLDLFYCDNIDF